MSKDQWEHVRNEDFDRQWREQFGPEGADPPTVYQHTRRNLMALVGREPTPGGEPRWHISVRYGEHGKNGRIPTWEELVEVAHDLRPGMVFVIPMPPRSWWINVHPDVLHLWEIRDQPLTDMWRMERQGHRPT